MRRTCAVITLAGLVVLAGSALAAETRVGAKGQFYVDGKPTVPFGVWQQPPRLFSYNRTIGIDCLVYPPAGTNRLDSVAVDYAEQAAVNGLGAIMPFKEKLADLEGLWCWVGGGRSGPEAQKQYQSLRSRDPKHAIMTNIGSHWIIKGENPEAVKQNLGYADCIVGHVWPEMFDGEERNLRNVALYVDALRQACKDRPGGEVSIWPDINPHKWQRTAREGGTIYKEPTPKELQFQIWLALIHGADGICIFPISFDPFVFSQVPTRNVHELQQQSKLVKRFAGLLTAAESPLAIKVTGDNPKGIADFTTRRHEGADYVLLVNGTADPQTVRLRVENAGGKIELRDAIADKPLESKDNGYQENLEGLDLRIWRIVTPGSEKSKEESKEMNQKKAKAED